MIKTINYIIENRYKIFLISLFVLVFMFIIKFNYNKQISISNIPYLTQYTYYYPSDATGSSNCTSSHKCIDDFTTDSNGWYHYNYNGKDYLVIAAALKKCRDDVNHCGINIQKHGMSTTINYYDLYDTLKLTIDGKNYDALVLDACGACMWGRQDDRGQELFDIFVQNGSAKNPGGGGSIYTGFAGNGLEHFNTIYTGNIEEGWLYNRFNYKELFGFDIPEYKIEKNIDESIDEIFDRAKTLYFSTSSYSGGGGSSGGYIAKDCDEMEKITGYDNYSSWKQYGMAWSNLKLGVANDSNIGRIGCLVTSIAIQMKSMNALGGINNFNPGTFACQLLRNNKFTSGGALHTDWSSAVSGISETGINLSGDKQQKISAVQSLIDSGCKVVLRVKTGAEGQHWVAVSGTTSNNINIIDPGYNRNTAWPSYSVYGVSYARCLKAS